MFNLARCSRFVVVSAINLLVVSSTGARVHVDEVSLRTQVVLCFVLGSLYVALLLSWLVNECASLSVFRLCRVCRI